MSVKQLLGLFRRHIIAVSLILVITAGIAVYFKSARPDYTDTATVAVEPASIKTVGSTSINRNYLHVSSLIATCQVLVMRLDGPQGQATLQRAGILGKFKVTIVNSYNLDYPSYMHPYLTVSATSQTPEAAHSVLKRGLKIISAELASFQEGSQLLAQDQISAYMLSDGGPMSQRGSMTRVYASLVFLCLVALYVTSSFLDRRSRGSTSARRERTAS